MKLQRNNKLIVAVLVIIIAISALYASTLNRSSEHKLQAISSADPEPFYLGVTYCGNSVADAKQLIDKVKGYTNLIVIQSGELEIQQPPEKLNEICDYAVNSGLNFIVYFGSQHGSARFDWLMNFHPAWKNHFLGIYLGDELGGKMLDSNVWFTNFNNDPSFINVNKYANGSFSRYIDEARSTAMYQPDGSIELTRIVYGSGYYDRNITLTTYYPDGTITTEFQEGNKSRVQVVNNKAITLSYNQLWSQRPFQTYDETAERFIRTSKSTLDFKMPTFADGTAAWNITHFTSDYALYWYDYQSNYDVVLAQFGWNQTLTQDIDLVRGAANLQNKSWGAIITWKYTQAPYLDSGDAIYNQMRTAYEAGAKYLVIFNFAENMTGPYGTLQLEHFDALKCFWNEVAQNSSVKRGGVTPEAVLVLPHDYGWGMRSPQDNIWGIWRPDSKSLQIWNELQTRLTQYGTRLDIVYEDQALSVEGKYPQVYFWNQTSK
jgi:hypothetical protein